MSSVSLTASLSCSLSSKMAENTSMISFILLSPCPQRLLLASVDIVFLFVLFVFAVQKLRSRLITSHNGDNSSIDEPLVAKTQVSVETNLWFKVSLFVSAVLAVLATVSFLSGFTQKAETQWELIDGICWLLQAISFVVITVLIVHEKRFQSVTHPVTLRVFWVTNFVAIALIALSSINRLVHHTALSKTKDITSAISLPFSAFFLIASVIGSSGITLVTPDSKPDELNKSLNVSGWASASIISKTFWIWLNPLLKKGYKTPLTLDDIPTLSPEHRAEKMSLVFERNWPKLDCQISMYTRFPPA